MPTTRHATVTTPASAELLLTKMHGREALSQLFTYELELVSESFNIKSEELLGKSVTVHMETVGKELRHFNGICSHFAFAGSRGRYAAYRATLRPWFWLMSQFSGNTLYKDITVPELVLQLFRLKGFTDVDPPKLAGTYEKRELIVQYRESLFHFISRWLEHEGIYYYFKHTDGCHKLCLADDSTAGSTVPKYEELRYRAPTKAGRAYEDHFEEWLESANVVPQVQGVHSYNFKTPRVTLQRTLPVPDEEGADRVVIETPGTHLTPEVGERYAKQHAEETRAAKVLFEGSGNVRGLSPGAHFTLTDHTRESFNQKYCIVSAEYALQANEFESSAAAGELQIRSHYRAIEATVPFRPPQRTTRPAAAGPESALVVGTPESEISTEKYGRIRVQFHWDKEHEKNEDSSCWIRVAQPWAGADFGFQFIPRVGHEVLVDFLNGNPDEPVIIGSVYNEDNQPPFTLDKNRTQSGIRTRSSKDGDKNEYNQLSFEDDKGHEEVYLQAQRDFQTLVKHDQGLTVQNDRKKTVTGREDNKIDGGRETVIEKFDNLTVNSANKNTTVHGQFNTIADEHYKVLQNATQIFLKDKVYVESDGNIELTNGATRYAGTSGGKLSLSADAEVSIKCGAASIKLTSDGTIEVSGLKVTIGAPGSATEYAPTGVTVTAPKVTQSGMALHELVGPIIKIG